MTQDDEFISVDFIKVSNILFTECFEKLQSVSVNKMGSFTRRSIRTVSLEMVQADVKFGAGGGICTGTVQPIALVVMCTDLSRDVEECDHTI